jgi:hypothetical protein
MRAPTRVSDRDLKAITVFLASTATPLRGGLPYLDAVLPAENRLTATRVLRDLGALPRDAILYLLAQPLLDLASDHLTRDQDLTTRYEERFEVEDRHRLGSQHPLTWPGRSLAPATSVASFAFASTN